MRTHDYTQSQSEHVSELCKDDLVLLLADLRADDIQPDMEVIAACEKYGITPSATRKEAYA